MSAPELKDLGDRWRCVGVRRCDGGAVSADVTAATPAEAHAAWERQIRSRIRAMDEEERNARWAAGAEGMR